MGLGGPSKLVSGNAFGTLQGFLKSWLQHALGFWHNEAPKARAALQAHVFSSLWHFLTGTLGLWRCLQLCFLNCCNQKLCANTNCITKHCPWLMPCSLAQNEATQLLAQLMRLGPKCRNLMSCSGPQPENQIEGTLPLALAHVQMQRPVASSNSPLNLSWTSGCPP